MRQNTFIHFTKQGLLGLAALCWAVCAVATGGPMPHPSSHALTRPFTMHDDFQENNLGQWASYPAVQDVGYDPSLSPTTDYGAPGGRALMRVVKPTRVGDLRFGFIKHVNMVMTEESRLSFDYQLRSPTAGAIEIGLACTDGHRYTLQVPARVEQWARVETSLEQLRDAGGRPPAAGVGIEALYSVAHLQHADPDIIERFIIDNVTLIAAQDARFEIRTPPASVIEPWAAMTSAIGYHAGETISIEAVAPGRLTHAQCVVETMEGRLLTTQPLYDDGTHGDRQAGDGVWSNHVVYTVRTADKSGLWMLKLSGTTVEGQSVSTEVRFLVHPAGAQDHPRLFFSAVDREVLVARMRDPKVAALWAKLQETAKKARENGNLADGGTIFGLLDTQYLLPSLPGYFDVLTRARARLSYNAFVAYLTGDSEARAAAKSALLDVSRWGTWVPPWFEAHGQHTYYPAGELAVDVAFAYDLLHDELTESERALVRRALLERCIIPTYHEYVLDNRVMANTSNWIAHTVGGALIAAAAIVDETTASESNERIDPYINGLLLKFEDHMAASYLSDGSYGEGIDYQEFDLESVAAALDVLNRVFGINYWKHTHVEGSLAFPLYTLSQPLQMSLDMGDSGPPGGRTLAPLVFRSKDPVLRWYYNRFDHSLITDFLWFDDSVTPHPPELPTSRLFPVKGNAVFRTGWGPDDWILLFHAGPNFNHNHNDQGSFLLDAFGEKLVTEGGWAHYYKDPYYTTYFTQAVGHNTVLVDENPESQLIADTQEFAALHDYPKITDAITSEFYDAVSSDLTPVYRNRLEHYTRRIVFVKPHYFVIYDDLNTQGTPARFDWLLHFSDRARIQIAQQMSFYTGEKAALLVRTFAPADAKLLVRNAPLPYGEFASETSKEVPPQPAYLDVQTQAASNAAQFLHVVVPARTVDGARELASHFSEVKEKGWLGVQAERGPTHDLMMFRRGDATGPTPYGDWSVDAAAWTLTESSERIEKLAAQSARSIAHAGRSLFTSEQPVSVAIEYGTGSVKIVSFANSPAKLQLWIGANPLHAQLDHHEMAAGAWKYGRFAGMVEVAVPAGQHHIKILLR